MCVVEGMGNNLDCEVLGDAMKFCRLDIVSAVSIKFDRNIVL